MGGTKEVPVSRITRAMCEDLEELTFELLIERVREKTATAGEIKQVMDYLGEKNFDLLGTPDEDAADDILGAADREDFDLPFIEH
jgi:hypothetical protein